MKKTKDDIAVRKIKNNGSDAWIYRGTTKQIKKSCSKYKTEDDFKCYVLSIINIEQENQLGTQSSVAQTSESLSAEGDIGSTTSPDNDDADMDFTNLKKEPNVNASVTLKLDIQPLPAKPKPIPMSLLKSVKVKPNKLNKLNPAKFVKKITTDNSFLDDIFAEDDVIIKEHK